MSISAKELASILGVSPATISMVFNDKPGISDATKEMVLRAAAEYGYTGKKTKKAEAPAPVIQFVTYKKHEQIVANTPFFSELTAGITQECSRQGFALHVSDIIESGDVKAQTDALRKVDCAGILLLATEMSPEDFSYFSRLPFPVVVLDCYYDGLARDCVLINNVQGAFEATEYLIRCGHTRIGYLHSSVPCANFSERADGFYKALRSHGIAPSSAPVHLLTSTSQDGYRDMMRILSDKPDLAGAYFADNDIIAAAAMKAFQECGYRIPEDISIIGFDDMPLCDMMNPALSTMNVAKRDLGAEAVNQLILRAKNPDRAFLKVSLSTTLVCRESVLNISI